MISIINSMIQKFRININQIISNSDNTIDDIMNESFIIINEYSNEISKNNNIFINELRKRCLKFNKYNKRIESKERWEEFNNREECLKYEYTNKLDIDEDLICVLTDIKNIINKDEYNFLIYYFSHTGKETAFKFNLNEHTVKNRVESIINKIRIKMEVVK